MLLALCALASALMVGRLVPAAPGAGKMPAAVSAPLLPTVLTSPFVWRVIVDSRADRLIAQTDRGLQVIGARGAAPLLPAPSSPGMVLVPLAMDQRTGHLFAAALRPGRSDGLAEIDLTSGRVLRTLFSLSAPGSPYTGGRPTGVALDAGTGRLFVVLEGIHQPTSEFHYTDAIAVSTLDARSGRVLRTSYVGRAGRSLLLDERTQRVFVATVHTVAVLDAHDGAVLRTYRPSPTAQDAHLSVAALATQSGRVLVINDNTGDGLAPARMTLTLLDTHSGQAVATFPGSQSTAIDDQRGVVYVAAGGRIVVRALRDGAILRRLPAAPDVSALAVDTRAGDLLVATTGPTDAGGLPRGRGHLARLDPATGVVLGRFTTGYLPSQILLLPQSGRAYVVSAGARRDGPAPLTLPASITLLDHAR